MVSPAETANRLYPAWSRRRGSSGSRARRGGHGNKLARSIFRGRPHQRRVCPPAMSAPVSESDSDEELLMDILSAYPQRQDGLLRVLCGLTQRCLVRMTRLLQALPARSQGRMSRRSHRHCPLTQVKLPLAPGQRRAPQPDRAFGVVRHHRRCLHRRAAAPARQRRPGQRAARRRGPRPLPLDWAPGGRRRPSMLRGWALARARGPTRLAAVELRRDPASQGGLPRQAAWTWTARLGFESPGG